MNRLQATMAQTHAVGRLNVQLDAEKLVKRIYQTQRPVGTANADVERYLIDNRLAFRVDGGPLLRLTWDGKRLAKELGA